jgi:D-alanine--poly(phosphoribitol) ligase subunit 2
MRDVIARLSELFVETLHIEAPTPDTDLFESGTLDSLQLVELLMALERCFGVRIAIESIDLEQLRTLERIARLVAANPAADETSQRKVAFG